MPAPRYLTLPYPGRCRTNCWTWRKAARFLKQSQTTITLPSPNYDLYRPFSSIRVSLHGLEGYHTIALYGKKLPPGYHNAQVGNIIGHRGQGSPTHLCNSPPGPWATALSRHHLPKISNLGMSSSRLCKAPYPLLAQLCRIALTRAQ